MNTKVFNHLRELVKQVNDEELREKLVLAASDARPDPRVRILAGPGTPLVAGHPALAKKD